MAAKKSGKHTNKKLAALKAKLKVLAAKERKIVRVHGRLLKQVNVCAVRLGALRHRIAKLDEAVAAVEGAPASGAT